MNWKMKYYLINFEYDMISNSFRFNTQKYLVINNSEIIYNINNDFIYIDRDNIRNESYLVQLLESEEIKKSIYSYIDNISGY